MPATKLDLGAVICDIAEKLLASRSRMERHEIVSKTTEAFILHVLEADPRFRSYRRGLFWELAEVAEQNELARRAQEERVAEAARAGAPAEAARLAALAVEQGVIVPRGLDNPSWEPGIQERGVLEQEEVEA